MTIAFVIKMILYVENKKATGSESNKPEVEANGYKCHQSSPLHTLVPTVAPALWSVLGVSEQ